MRDCASRSEANTRGTEGKAMIAWLWKLIIGDFRKCSHKWEIIKEGRWKDIGYGTAGDFYTLQCKECGDIKSRKG